MKIFALSLSFILRFKLTWEWRVESVCNFCCVGMFVLLFLFCFVFLFFRFVWLWFGLLGTT